MGFSFLYAIPRSGLLDSFFLGVTKIAGSFGQLWVVIALGFAAKRLIGFAAKKLKR